MMLPFRNLLLCTSLVFAAACSGGGGTSDASSDSSTVDTVVPGNDVVDTGSTTEDTHPADTNVMCTFVPTGVIQYCRNLGQICMTGPITCPDGTMLSATCECRSANNFTMAWQCDMSCPSDDAGTEAGADATTDAGTDAGASE